MNRAHSQLAERQQNSRFQRSDIADVLPPAMLVSLVIAAAPADIAPATSAARAEKGAPAWIHVSRAVSRCFYLEIPLETELIDDGEWWIHPCCSFFRE